MSLHTNQYYLTTPIFYVNDVPHIGHAYTMLACDTMARFLRLDGAEVKFVTGTDEHGQKVEQSAALTGILPQQFADQVSETFRNLAAKLAITNDDFIRTTESRHIRACQELWRVLVDRGEIYLGAYSGWYAVRDEAFYNEDELIDGKAPTGAAVEWVEEPSYFFRLSAWQDRLLQFYEDHPDFIAPKSRRNEVISFVKSGLQDLSISRTSFKWGIPVPGDPNHVMYVWFDALINYLSATGYPDSSYTKWWPADLHMVGKDILRFHAVYWPAFLLAAGLPPPKRVFAHGWWTHVGQKISKSLGNTIDPVELVDAFGLDTVRYFLLREVRFGQDGDFSRTQLELRHNSDLANDFGNLAQRVLSLIAKNCGAEVPLQGALLAQDNVLLNDAYALPEILRTALREQAFHSALEAIWRVVSSANRYIDTEAPWALRKTDYPRMATVLAVLAEILRILGLAALAFIPDAAAKLLDQLAIAPDNRTIEHIDSAYRVASGTALPAPTPLFPRIQNENPSHAG